MKHQSTMARDYEAISKENRHRYGTDIGRIGQLLLANRYGDRTHFIYELLQNAEDALARRTDWQGSRAVSFELDADALRVSHFGVPFDEDDIRGVCGIAVSTKPLTAIGRFGIGFKSVFAFTDRPEVHSGAEAFAIESFVWPVATDPIERARDETVISIPLQEGDDAAKKKEIADALSRLGTTSLLFLREIEEINWRVDGIPGGSYLRDAVLEGPGVRRVTVVGEKRGEPDVDAEWLVFCRPVHTEDGELSGHVELAWLTGEDGDDCKGLTTVKPSPLVVFFPTEVETHLGFLVQGPYRTTPSRDNVPARDEWNRMCVRETGALLVDSLRWLRDKGLLDAAVLACLPMDRARFEESRFRRLFEDAKMALGREELLPALDGTYVRAEDGRLARGEELRQLLSPTQLGALHGRARPLHWLEGTISRDRTPELRRYLVQELAIRELTPEALLKHLTGAFLEAQTDEWIQGLYEFLGARPALRSRVKSLPIIRLEDGSHVTPTGGDEPLAFLPGPLPTSFPTVRADVCRTDAAREFLKSLDLTEPEPVDNVIRNILPKYREGVELSEAEYAFDIGLMLGALGTDSRAQQDRLVRALGATPWVRAVDGAGKRGVWAKPGNLYFATQRLQNLFDGVEDVFLVDPDVSCLTGEEPRRLLERSGATRYLNPVKVDCDLPQGKLDEIRRGEGLETMTWGSPEDKTIHGVDALLDKFTALDSHECLSRARDLWIALADLNKRRGSWPFEGVYTWGYSHQRRVAAFDAAFVRTLNERPWIPDSSGRLRRPGSVAFEETGWEPDSFLESRIRFKPPLLEHLAREAGIEPGALDLLRQMDVTTEAELRKRLGIHDHDQDRPAPPQRKDRPPLQGEGDKPNEPDEHDGESSGDRSESNDSDSRPPSGRAPPRRFVSYVSVRPEDEDTDPDGLEHSARMDLERRAIGLILESEPRWRETPPNNPGFDLYRGPAMDRATHWCEVKAMKGALDDRPVGISRTQFEWAQRHRDKYWLYVVERAGKSDFNVVRIQDPVGKARSFTFDGGWRAVAE